MARTPRLLRAFILLLLVVASPRFAAATILPVDLNAPGDGLLTRDTASGLDWLDLDLSAGVSYDQVAAGWGGFQGLGFRHATEVEVLELMQHFGFPPLGRSLPYLDAVNFIRTLSCTEHCNSNAFGAIGLVDRFPFDPDSKLVFGVQTSYEPSHPPPLAYVNIVPATPESSYPFRGNYLVRPTPGPAPIGLLLAVAGVLAIRELRTARG